MKPRANPTMNRHERPDGGDAFLPDIVPTEHAGARARILDDEAEACLEEFIAEATSAEHVGEDARNEPAPDEHDALTVMYPALVDEVDLAALEVPRLPARRGFAAMDRERVREIARKGGAAAHRLGTAHRFTPEEARTAGRKGGTAPHKSRGPRSAAGI